jgi:hypothetical protein
MAAAAGLVGTLLVHICTNHEAIMNGTQADGESLMTEGNCKATQAITWSVGMFAS